MSSRAKTRAALSEAIDRLSDLMPFGHLLGASELLNAASTEIAALRARVAELEAAMDGCLEGRCMPGYQGCRAARDGGAAAAQAAGESNA